MFDIEKATRPKKKNKIAFVGRTSVSLTKTTVNIKTC